jgi:GAF domain-containing protein/HAMP domain-containing protein
MEIFGRYLSLPENQRKGSPEEKDMKLTLQVLDMDQANGANYLSSYALLDNKGVNAYDSFNDRIASRLPPEAFQSLSVDLQALLPGQGTNEGAEDYFKAPMRNGTAFISPVQLSSSARGFFYISAPVKDAKGNTIGVLRARYDGLLLQDLVKQYNGLLTSKSYAILVDENNIRLADAFTPNYIYKSVAPLPKEKVQALQASHRLANLPANMLATNYTEFDRILNNYEKAPVFTTTYSLVYNDDQHSEIGAIARLRAMPWRIVYLRADYSAADVRRSQMQITTLITVIIAGLVAILAVIASQWLSRPIDRLTQTAQEISNGDLNAQAPAQSADEFGMLGAAFNLMTRQMRELITQLEDRVKARTQEIETQNETLSNRARQFQTVADVARQIVSAQELEKLLTAITQLVSDRFGFYHVGIFLLDENKQYAVLRAANSPGGQRMLARRHMLPVGKVGIVGFATGQGQARIATDVGEDATYFNNPDLPETRSEMALPLKVGDEVIGALDIQSMESNAFHEDDIELFTTLADQVAIAIYNNQLYTATRRALEEAQTLHRQYLRGEWAQETAHRKTLGYLYNQSDITPQESESPLWEEVFDTGETIRATQPGAPEKAIVAVPISLRGETIGVIQIQDQRDTQIWSEDEINMVNSIAGQVAVALENARLFENTVRRAEREQKVLRITEKIRSTNDPGEMMSIAIRELQQALGASRAQIYIRQSGAEKAGPPDQDATQVTPDRRKNGNGRHAGPPGGSAS